VRRLLVEAGLPPELFAVVSGEGDRVGTALVDHTDYVCFTGSTATGREVAARAGRNLVDCSMELGGKNPLLVLDDADPERAASGAVRACFANAGQLCISTERLYVDDAVYDEFCDAFVGETRALRLGTGFDYAPDIGSLQNADQLAKTTRHVEDAVEQGRRCSWADASAPTSGRTSTNRRSSRTSRRRWQPTPRRRSARW